MAHASTSAQDFATAIGTMIEIASAEGGGVVIRVEGGRSYQPRGTVTLGSDHLRFLSADQEGHVFESIVPLRAIVEVARSVR